MDADYVSADGDAEAEEEMKGADHKLKEIDIIQPSLVHSQDVKPITRVSTRSTESGETSLVDAIPIADIRIELDAAPEHERETTFVMTT